MVQGPGSIGCLVRRPIDLNRRSSGLDTQGPLGATMEGVAQPEDTVQSIDVPEEPQIRLRCGGVPDEDLGANQEKHIANIVDRQL